MACKKQQLAFKLLKGVKANLKHRKPRQGVFNTI